jgi:PAS domain S-box-containing protein
VNPLEPDTHDDLLSSPLKLSERQSKMVYSPLRLILILTLCIFVTEISIMFLLNAFSRLPQLAGTIIDAAILSVVLFLALFFYLFRPLVHLIHDCHLQEDQLKIYQGHLEQLVQERTESLDSAYRRLQDENEETLKAKKNLLESEERFRQIFEHSEDAIVLLGPNDGSVIDLNPTAEQIFHRSKAEIQDSGLHALCSPDGYRRLTAVFRQIAQENTPGMIEKLECSTASGEVRILSFRGKKITLQGVDVIYTTFRDITARIRMEDEARQIQAHLIHANRMTTLGTMVSSVAHEINNPNNFLLMNTDIIKRAWSDIVPVVDESYRINGDFAVGQTTWSEARNFLPEAIDGIQQGATRISSIVGTLKAFGRDERLTSEAVADVNQVVQLSAAILNQQISRSTHRFQVKLADDLPPVKGVARQLEQVVINLIQNALQALPDPERGVQVTTGTDPDSGDVLIRVRDEGNGIPPEIAARIMEPFFTTRLEQGGTGLGLAISGTIVKEHGGEIEFSTEPGKGSTFTVRLCRVPPDKSMSHTSEVNHDNH